MQILEQIIVALCLLSVIIVECIIKPRLLHFMQFVLHQVSNCEWVFLFRRCPVTNAESHRSNNLTRCLFIQQRRSFGIKTLYLQSTTQAKVCIVCAHRNVFQDYGLIDYFTSFYTAHVHNNNGHPFCSMSVLFYYCIALHVPKHSLLLVCIFRLPSITEA